MKLPDSRMMMKVGFWAASLFAAGVVVCLLDMSFDKLLCAPPSGAATFADVLPCLPDHEPVWLVTIDGKSCVVVFGNSNPFNEYSSGYLFDLSGELLFWAADANQSNKMRKYWSVARLGDRASERIDGVDRRYGTRQRLGTTRTMRFPIVLGSDNAEQSN